MGRRRLIGFALLGIGAYVLGMVATIPASIVFKNRPWRSGVAGTIWNGEVGIAGGSRIAWNWSPLRSITSLGYAADWKASGPDTDLGGRVLAGLSSTMLDKVSGSATTALLQAIQPNLPFTCDMTAQVEIERLAIGGSSQMMRGQIVTDPGSCGLPGAGAGASSPVPSLIVVAEHIGKETRIRVAPATQRRKTLIDGVLKENGELELRLTPDGAGVLPFIPLPPGAPFKGKV